MASVPFKVELSGEGLLRVDAEYVVIEFRKYGLFKKSKDVIVSPVPLLAITSATFKRGLFGNVIVLQAGSMNTFQDFPGHDRGELKLQVERKHRDLADQFVSTLSLKLAELELRRLEEEPID